LGRSNAPRRLRRDRPHPRQRKLIYSVDQNIPLWGKRDLGEDAARAEVDQMVADNRSTEAELIEKVEVAFEVRGSNPLPATTDSGHSEYRGVSAALGRPSRG
jgi:hypothetical protein